MNIKSKFVIMDHEAKRARYHQDLRFKKPDGNLWDSFAVRKGVPTQYGIKVLAIHTHDHTEKDALFTGVIDDGYGAGKLDLFDKGDCIIEKYTNSHIVLNFKGRKIKGRYHLVSTVVMKNKSGKIREYFLFKGKV